MYGRSISSGRNDFGFFGVTSPAATPGAASSTVALFAATDQPCLEWFKGGANMPEASASGKQTIGRLSETYATSMPKSH
jgi:hypothetical protein